jgi:MFS family permease
VLRFRRALLSLVEPLALLAAVVPAAAPLLTAPLAGRGRVRGPATRLRRSMRYSTVEGMFCEVFNACAGPTVLTGFALWLGAAPIEAALLGQMPTVAQLVQVPAAWVTSAFGRRRTAVVAVGLSRQALLPLAALPFLPIAHGPARAILVGFAALSGALGVVANNAWTAWMGDLVPARIRGRYFGRRTAICVLGGMVGSLAAGRFLDVAARRAVSGQALATLAVLGSVVGALTTWLMARQHEPAGETGTPPHAAAALRPLRDPAVRPFLAYHMAWNAAVGLGGGFYAFHLLQNLRVGFTVVALQAAGVSALRIFFAPLWGRAIDRLGTRPVLAACSFGIAVQPLVWILVTPQNLWPLALDAALGGVFWGGYYLAAFAAPLAMAPRRERPFYLAAFAMAGGIATAAATALGGVAAAALPARFSAMGHVGYGLHVLFLASAGGRLASAFLALRIEERGAGTLIELHRMAAGAVGEALAGARTRRAAGRR